MVRYILSICLLFASLSVAGAKGDSTAVIAPPTERSDRSPLQGGDLGVGKKQEGTASGALLFFDHRPKN